MDLSGSIKDPKRWSEPPARRDPGGPGEEALIIFAALPKPGDVKKRLAREIGAQPAAALYNELALNTFRAGQYALDRGWMVFLFHSPKVREEEVRQWVRKDFRYVAEQGANPGARIQYSFDFVFHHRQGKR